MVEQVAAGQTQRRLLQGLAAEVFDDVFGQRERGLAVAAAQCGALRGADLALVPLAFPAVINRRTTPAVAGAFASASVNLRRACAQQLSQVTPGWLATNCGHAP